jgi:hypothetical protein
VAQTTTRPATRRPGSRAAGPRRGAPTRSPEFDSLTLAALRAYRSELSAVESRVSYWRRLVQARLDVLTGGARMRGGAGADRGQLRDLLSDPREASRRKALVAVIPADDVPPLPNLAELWAELPGDEDARGALAQRLTCVEKDLSAYRVALHERLDRATSELIARYHENPRACLVALPLQR